SAGAHNGLLRLVVEAVFALELGNDGLTQFRDTGNRRVLRFAAIDRVDGSLLDIRGRVEVGLARSETNHVLALGFQFTCFLADRDGRRWLYTRKGVGEKCHDRSP